MTYFHYLLILNAYWPIKTINNKWDVFLCTCHEESYFFSFAQYLATMQTVNTAPNVQCMLICRFSSCWLLNDGLFRVVVGWIEMWRPESAGRRLRCEGEDKPDTQTAFLPAAHCVNVLWTKPCAQPGLSCALIYLICMKYQIELNEQCHIHNAHLLYVHACTGD